MMADLTFFQYEFDRLASDGALGDPHGKPGYAYLRVSSSGQAEEGRSGLPRQIARVHEAAAKNGVRIPWNMVYADDHTGFEFKDRPELSRLRDEYRHPRRQADVIVIEYLDRLSRNADWHQGYLLDEMQQHQMEVLFWKGFSSRIERAVMGAISQDGMERSIEIMQEGRLNKARSGRITAKRRAYGYRFVDAEGKESPRASRDTYYAIREDEAEIIRIIYRKVAAEGIGMKALCRYLEDRFPPPGRYQHWQTRQVSLFIRNPLYKGEFYANRYQKQMVVGSRQRPDEPTKMFAHMVERPKEEWILVPVPPIVSPELWQAANDMLDKNRRMSPRNGRKSYLLTGLIKCNGCGHNYCGAHKKQRWKSDPNRISHYLYYKCIARNGHAYHSTKAINCNGKQISAPVLEQAVWNVICETILKPELLLEQLDAELENGENSSLKKQIAFLQRQIKEGESEDEKLYRAFMADVFDEHEYRERRRLLKEKQATLQSELKSLEERTIDQQRIEEDKATILALSKHFQKTGIAIDPPFEVKRRIVKLLVDQIILDANGGWFRIEGRIPGTWPVERPIVGSSVRR
ncbi:MAG: recombinase family protein [Caldilineaceae bacterium]